jgi:anti-anti-sigma factor
MEITLSMVDEIPVMSLVGRLDVTTSPLLEERLLPAIADPGSKIILDCGELTYVSSAGLRVFITSQRRLSEQGGALALASLSKPVLELFRLAGLENLFVITATTASAAERLR